jgi:glycine dehydrogenase subunit 1
MREMLAQVGVPSVESLFEAVPQSHRFPEIELPEPASELEIMAELRQLSERNVDVLHTPCFLGAGAYHHFIPSVVQHIIGRSEFYTAYTPYQPEVSQGTLQAIFEYQTMICELTGLDVSNASHYDGATALAEAVIMALSVFRGRRSRVVVSRAVHPEYRETMRTYTQGMDIRYVGDDDPSLSLEDLGALVDDDTACLVVQSPDFFGRIHDLAPLAEAAHTHGSLLVVVSNPIALGMLQAPGAQGADIALGEGQPLGNALNYGGPYLGFFACRQEHVRRLAGRLVGETVDVRGQRGYVLTLSTREQHIRREKATSNICTNQGLNALAAAVYLAALGKCGLRQVAQLCYHKAHHAAAAIDALAGYRVEREAPFFHEFVVHCPRPVADINAALLGQHGIIGGFDLGRFYPERAGQMLLCVTEMNSASQIDRLVSALQEAAR